MPYRLQKWDNYIKVRIVTCYYGIFEIYHFQRLPIGKLEVSVVQYKFSLLFYLNYD